jgi:hypothetical protein
VIYAAPDGVELRALTGHYVWGPGVRPAECVIGHPEGVPATGCGCGLWGFKTLPEAIRQEGGDSDRVFALTEHWGEAIEHETGLRSRFAEIVAFIEPTRSSHLARFPADGLRATFPGVPVIGQAEIKGVVEERGLATIPRADPPPVVQRIVPGGELRWAPKSLGPEEEGAVPLPVAAGYPDRTVVVGVPAPGWVLLDTEERDTEERGEPDATMVPGSTAYRLGRATFEYDPGRSYAFWQRENPASRLKGLSEVCQLLRRGGTKMDTHLLTTARQYRRGD